MNRRSFLSTALAPSVALLQTWAQQQRMNVLFMVADDMNNALGCFGNTAVKTPHLDRLASTGVRFDRAYCQFPLCAPSRASFLSGRRPQATGVLSLNVPTRKYMQDVVMLPEFFRKQGYFSVDCGKIFHTGADHDDPKSWDFVLQESGKKPEPSEVIESHEAGKPRNHTMEWIKLRTPDEQTPDGIVARTAVEKMREAVAANKSFFLGVGFRRPHSPYSVPKKYFDLYNPEKLVLPERGDPDSILPAAWYEMANQPALTTKEQREFLAAYYACNSFVDAQAGVILKTLDEMKLADRTAVVFFGDHGYHNGDHGMWHKMTLFESSCRVPLIVRVPGSRGNGKPSRALVELIDLYPTLAEAAGYGLPSGLEGESLRPYLEDPSRAGKKAVFTSVGRNDDRRESHLHPSYFGRSVRTDRWRYTEWEGGKRGTELYDEVADPKELRNLAGDPKHAATVQELRALLGPEPDWKQ